MQTIEINTKRQPSRAQIMKVINQQIKLGNKDIDIRWGENWIELIKGGSNWHGAGWINKTSGDDIARTLNVFPELKFPTL